MVKGKASSSSSGGISSVDSFIYPERKLEEGDEDGDDYSWVCTKTRKGNVSSAHNAKFGYRVDLRVSVGPLKKKPCSIWVSGKTWRIQQEIKSFAQEEHVMQVNWISNEGKWLIKLDDDSNIHALIIKIQSFLNACLVAKLVNEFEVRSERAKAVRKKKRLIAEEGSKINEEHALHREERIVALKTWREEFASSFEGRFSWGQWYNIGQQRENEASHITKCSKCNHDQFNYYGSEKWPFDSHHAPTLNFLEQCYNCDHYFFELLLHPPL